MSACKKKKAAYSDPYSQGRSDAVAAQFDHLMKFFYCPFFSGADLEVSRGGGITSLEVKPWLSFTKFDSYLQRGW